MTRMSLASRTGAHEHIFYRRRPKNTERKAGNVAEWVRRFGSAYPQMLTLDADSVMDGATIVRLVAAMEQNSGVALIQTLPVIVNGATLFARMQQFAGRVYGPLIAHGIAWWHKSEGNYCGHNAIIRTAAFAAQAGSPPMLSIFDKDGTKLFSRWHERTDRKNIKWKISVTPGDYILEIQPKGLSSNFARFLFLLTSQ